MKQLNLALMLAAAVSIPVLAGPPLVCHPVEIGNAQSLPWRHVNGWDGAEAKYDVAARLTGDTLALLAPATPLNVRMETLRRAAIYSVRKDGLPDRLTLQLLARAANADAAGKPDAMAWFDAGYYVEALRQMGFVRRFDMLSAEEKAMWKWQYEAAPAMDGKPWLDRAVALGAKGLEVAMAKVDEYRQADLKRIASAKR